MLEAWEEVARLGDDLEGVPRLRVVPFTHCRRTKPLRQVVATGDEIDLMTVWDLSKMSGLTLQ